MALVLNMAMLPRMNDAYNELVNRAIAARSEHRLNDAKASWTEALALARHSSTKAELICALKGLGQIERDLHHNDAALPLYEEAVVLGRQIDDPLSLAHTIRHFGDILRHAGKRH